MAKPTLEKLLETHPDDFYRILLKSSLPLATLSYAGRNNHTEIVKAVLQENRAEFLQESTERISHEYYQTTPETRRVLKEFLPTDPEPNCRVS